MHKNYISIVRSTSIVSVVCGNYLLRSYNVDQIIDPRSLVLEGKSVKSHRPRMGRLTSKPEGPSSRKPSLVGPI